MSITVVITMLHWEDPCRLIIQSPQKTAARRKKLGIIQMVMWKIIISEWNWFHLTSASNTKLVLMPSEGTKKKCLREMT